MGLIQTFITWNNVRYQKKVMKMKQLGICPDCKGQGFNLFAVEHFYSTSYECTGCNGSGSFKEWKKSSLFK